MNTNIHLISHLDCLITTFAVRHLSVGHLKQYFDHAESSSLQHFYWFKPETAELRLLPTGNQKVPLKQLLNTLRPVSFARPALPAWTSSNEAATTPLAAFGAQSPSGAIRHQLDLPGPSHLTQHAAASTYTHSLKAFSPLQSCITTTYGRIYQK